MREDAWAARLFTISFWGLNVGLFGMVALTLTPVGVLQMLESIRHGFHAARSLEFYRGDTVHTLLWLRMIPDTIFIVAGVVPLLAGLVRGVVALRQPSPAPGEGEPSLVRRRVREGRPSEPVEVG